MMEQVAQWVHARGTHGSRVAEVTCHACDASVVVASGHRAARARQDLNTEVYYLNIWVDSD
jgi:hypothetical protein